MSAPAKTRKRAPRPTAAMGRRGRVHTPHPYAVMVYRLSLAVLLTIVILHVGGK